MYHDKKRQSISTDDPYASALHPQAVSTSTSSSTRPPRRIYARPTMAYVNTSNPHVPHRSPSPPATAYFSGFGVEDRPDHRAPITARPDAQAHFAYSTQLRRHQVDAAGYAATPIRADFLAGGFTNLFGRAQKAWHRWRSDGYESLIENGRGDREQAKEAEPPKEGQSGKFSSWTVEDILAHFQTSAQHGLPSSAVQPLRDEFGWNEFDVEAPENLIIKFIKTIYESPLNLLLLGSALVSLFMGNIDDAVSITIAILIVLAVGFIQERRSEKSLEALNKLVPHHCHLVRDGSKTYTLANDLVPGDLVTFGVGDRIPADLRIIQATSLEIDESSLTGETVPSTKTGVPCPPGLPLAERNCMAFMGTLVRNGHGSGIVVATGTQTEFGVIFSMMQDVEEKRTPLQLSMDELAKKLSFISFGIIGMICLIGVIQERGWLEMFTIGVSLAVAAIPEGLPIVTTVTLALGVLRMSRKKAIVKKLPSVEALGCVSAICSDKTGTLTKNELTVTELYTVDDLKVLQVGMTHHGRISEALRKNIAIGNICNNAFRNSEGVNVGQSTDVALLDIVTTFGLQDAREGFTRTTEQPFSSENKYMAVSGTHVSETRQIIYFKGAIEAILDRCRFYYISGESTPGLDANTRNTILTRAHKSASQGLRVIAMAYAFGTLDPSQPSAQNNLVFVGYQAMHDPPRPGVAEAVQQLHLGGVKVIMITGDAETTALSIAKELGLKVQPGTGSCLTGKELDTMSATEVARCISAGVCVFARTTPRHKMLIVEALQGRGEIVGMTGDGVNDAPALKMANIGISMGKSGTDVAKEAADVILVDDNFATILKAVEEGKSIFHNIQNFISFQLSTAVAALSLITLSTVFELSNPLNAMQILFINILMDGPPSQSLGVDPPDPAVMRKPPRSKDASILTQRIYARVLFSASMIVLGTLFVYLHELSDGSMSGRDQTMTFTSFVFLDLVSALQNRGLGCGFFRNKMLLITVSTSFLVQLALIYVPIMQTVFQTEALRARDLSTLLMLAGTSFCLHELRRRYERKVYGSSTVFAGWAFLFVIIWIVTVVYCFFIPDSSVAYRPVEMTSEVNTETPIILVVNPNSSQSITDTIAATLKDSDGALEYMTGPPEAPEAINDEDQAKQSAEACLPVLLERMKSPKPPSAVLVACYSEHPLVSMLKEKVADPTFVALGIFEASIDAAVEVIKPGEKFGIITTGKAWEPLLTDGALKILGEKEDDDVEPDCFAGVIGTGLSVLELYREEDKDVTRLMAEAAKELVAKGATAICLGCAGMSGLEQTVQNTVTEEGKSPKAKVIDGVRAGIQALRDQMVKVKAG